MPVTDLLRVLVVPVFAWAAWRDHRTRRVPTWTWYPVAAVGVVLLVWDAVTVLGSTPFAERVFLIRVAVSVGFLVPIAYAFWYLGAFGTADAKAFAAIAILYPTYPSFTVGSLALPVVRPPLGVLSMSIITDAVLLAALYPLLLVVRNAAAGRFAVAMPVGRPVAWDRLDAEHGKLLETPRGFTRRGLDLDALRMYLRWRGLTIDDLRDRADTLRDPASLPEDPNPPTDGAVRPDGGDPDDPWGAAAFLDDIEGSAYGTTPGTLRDGLDLVAHADVVWISPGIPFLVPLVAGLALALTLGDALYGVLLLVGLA